MKKLLLLLILPLGMMAQMTLASWSFEGVTVSGTATTPTISSTIADAGLLVTGSVVSAIHASSSTTWTTQVGNGSLKSLSSTNWAVGDYYQFKFSTTNFQNIKIYWEQSGSNTGPKDFKVQYSTNGTSFTDLSGGTYTLVNSPAFSSSTFSSNHSKSADLSSFTFLDNQAFIYIRLVCNSTTSINNSTVSTAGTDRVDSFRVLGCKMASLNSSPATSLAEQCTDASSWTYYGNGTNNYFAIRKNGNTINATVDITTNGGNPYTSTSSNGTNLEHGSFLMGRHWNVTCTGCTYSLNGGVDVRFFYDPAELTAALSARDNAKSNLPISSLAVSSNGVEWFKTIGVPFTTTGIIGNNFPTTILKLPGTTASNNGVNYVQFTGINTFSGGTGGYSYGPPSSSSSNALPVTWGDIIVQSSNAGYRLDWNTHSEKNASHFVVESAEDGRNFKEVSSIIKAFGNSTTTQKYHFDHRDFSDKLYYRIKQVDFEGKFDYSKIVMAHRTAKDFFDLQVYPIPLSESSVLNISIKTNESSPLKIQLFDMDGKMVYNEIKSNEPSTSIDMSALSKGIYQLAVSCGSYKEVRKIVK